MSNIDVFRSGGLPSRENIRSFIAEAAARAPTSYDGKQYLKCDPYTGRWNFGKDSTPTEVDAVWAVNPLSFFTGYMAWGDGKVLGEHRQPANRGLPDASTLARTDAERGWEEMRGCELVCLTGKHAGTVCEFKGTSIGAIRSIDNLLGSVNTQMENDSDAVVPLVLLRDAKYENKKYHRTLYPPAFEITEWRTFGDTNPPAAESEEDPADDLMDEYARLSSNETAGEADAPRRRTRRF